MGELADPHSSKVCAREGVSVQIRVSLPNINYNAVMVEVINTAQSNAWSR